MRRGLLRSGVAPILFIILIAGALALSAGFTQAQSIRVLHYNPGDTISYTGSVSSGSTAEIILSTTTSVGVSGGNYQIQLSDITVPACSVIISVHNAQTLTFGGSKFLGNVLGQDIWTPEVTNSYDPGTPYQYDTGSGRYSVRVFGQAASGASSVSMDVYVKQTVSVSGGAYSISVSTANLPSGVYYLSQNGNVVAKIYLGISAPGSYTLNLKAGWNLVSLPITPENNRIDYIFSPEQQSNIDVIWDYNGGNWIYWTTEAPWNNNNPLKSLNPLVGYYIYCYNPITVTIYGSSPPAPMTWDQLVQGWNIVGYPSTSSARVDSLYSPADVVWKYDSGNWYYYTTEPDYANKSTLSMLEPGYGYWIYKL